jgi:kynureninase
MMQLENSLVFAKQLDADDELSRFRNKFIIPKRNGREQIYFLGNSLGLQPESTSRYIQQVLDQWASHGVESFFQGDNPWMNHHKELVKVLSKIVGAPPHELVVMNQLTVNLHLMMVSFYQPVGKRNKILCEAKAFPSDQYMIETHLKHLGLDPHTTIIEVSPRSGEHTIRTEDILETIAVHKDELALVLIGGVNYYTGQLFDMKAITAATHSAGAVAGYDLAHAAGNVPLSLHDWDVDFACWCSYKYLNSGPGAVSGVYIHERFHANPTLQRFGGWWGYDEETRFQMQKGFKPIRSAEGWQLSTPSMILFACHKAALDIFEEAGIDRLFKKGQALTEYLMFILNQVNNDADGKVIEILTPQNVSERGCQVSLLMLKDGKAIFEELSQQGIFTDWREPNVIRVAPVPLYNRFEEIFWFGETVKSLIEL